ncbi:hypothetical protein Cni_G19760 [Canna indica]|uniref:Uncharacterized protein n=1 Tax=Canna indica TaxID=4628 RepID=A0AAQ3KMN8_9LILI|nr:hypothetical protein Cni_G19760 [Canna indica]
MESPTRSTSHVIGCIASPSWFPPQRGHSRFQLLPRDGGLERSRSWRSILKRLLKESRSMYSCAHSKPPLSFGYDADSYSKNFDDGRWNLERDRIASLVFPS